MDRNPAAKYLENKVNTATPQQLTAMLYDGGIRFSRLAEKYMREEKMEQANHYLQRSQLIVQELMFSLNYDAGELAENLFQIYEYLYHRLVQANIRKDPEILPEVIHHLTELKDCWDQISGEKQAINYG